MRGRGLRDEGRKRGEGERIGEGGREGRRK